ncbi:HAAS signaling domain-containing protein [Micromonospora sp. H33]|uniref:HAAS signaling domain-containing protein n=1 Tax=Micromonospora sp. H33 TaxID=3452215 RepID=UPI003F89AC93
MTVTEQEITDYVARVRAALADLPPAVRDELTEDLAEHLAEVAAEADGSLVERLGEPEAYAVELRTAAGVGAARGDRRFNRRFGAAGDRLRARVRRWDAQLGPPLGYATASEFLRLLNPAWWVVRGYLAAMLITVITTGGSFGLLPSLNGSELAGLVLLGGSVLASIWLGHRTAGLSRPKRQLLLAGHAVLVVFALVGLVSVDDRARWNDYGYQQISIDGRYDHIRDVFVYDSEGRLVENARLFDQNGDPIRLGYPDCPDLRDPNGTGNPLHRAYPYCPEAAPFAPRPTATAPEPVLPPLPTASAGPTATAAPTATPAPTASAAATVSASPTPASPSAEPTG